MTQQAEAEAKAAEAAEADATTAELGRKTLVWAERLTNILQTSGLEEAVLEAIAPLRAFMLCQVGAGMPLPKAKEYLESVAKMILIECIQFKESTK